MRALIAYHSLLRIADNDQQLATRGDYNLHGPAGTITLAVQLICASHRHNLTRPTTATRKTAQVYYGHLDKPYLANDSVFPPMHCGGMRPISRRENSMIWQPQ
eukprot:COSAG06_NODE_3788_length_4901_cov_6.911287_3_plen_103_part_00